MTRLVVVGNGMAGSRLVEDIRLAEKEGDGGALAITLFGAEAGHAYNRIMLSHVLAGSARAEDIAISSTSWEQRHRVTMRLGVAVSGIDRDRREVVADDGSRTGYDYLVLATGSRARIPDLAGLLRADGSLVAGAAVFRTLADCRRILELVDEAASGHNGTHARSAVVLGGGLLGLEAARGLVERRAGGAELEVTVLHHGEHVMERQLDAEASSTLRRLLHRLDVPIATRAHATSVLTDGSGRLTGVRCADGREFAADLLVISCGVEPDASLGRAAGLAVNRAILVDNQLRSISDERIFAIGECCEHDGQIYGLLAPAWEQAAVVARVLTTIAPSGVYRGSRLVTRLKAAGVELAAMGEVHAEQAAGFDRAGHPVTLASTDPAATEVIRFADASRDTYHKLVIRDGRLVGAILIGESSTVGTLTQLYDRGSPVPSDRASLIFGGRGGSAEVERDNPTRIPDRTTICQCNSVTKGDLCAAFLSGDRTVAALARSTRATTGCGTCRDTVAAIVSWLEAAEPSDEPTPSSDHVPPALVNAEH